MGMTYLLSSNAGTERQIFQYGALQGCSELSLTKCMDQETDSSCAEGDRGSWEAELW